MNLIEVACSSEEGHLLGFVFANRHTKSVPELDEGGVFMRLNRSFELKVQILTEVFGWEIVVVDEKEFDSLPRDKTVREKYIHDKLESNFSQNA
jgi:hypothetical protein